ncbi:MAG TPA: hypothetical protein VF691_04220 [Cytophagaceae bacterium]|jgi:cbb3-type cytochrome oxidase subunit 3
MIFLKRNIKSITVILLILVIAIAFYAFTNKKKKAAMASELYRIIDGEIGLEVSDLKTLLDKVAPDEKYLRDKASNGLTKAANSAQILWEAFLWKDPISKSFWRRADDDEEAVRKTLQIKTKAQVKAVMLEFAKKYGQELDEFLRKYNNTQELKEYATIVSKLKN